MNVFTNAVSTPKVTESKPVESAELRQAVAQGGKSQPVVGEGKKVSGNPPPAVTAIAIADVSAHIAMVATSLSITVINRPAMNGPTVVARWPMVEFNAIAFGRIVGDTKLARNAA